MPLFASIGALFATFFLIGIGGATIDVGANAMLMWELGAEVGQSMNILHLCFGLGALSAPLFVYLGLDIAVRGAATACFVVALWALAVPAPVAQSSTDEQRNDTTWRLLLLLATFFMLYVGLEVGFAGWVLTYGEEINFSALGATWLTTVFWIGFTGGRLLSSAFGQKLRPKVLLAGACGLTLFSTSVLVIGDGRTASVWIGTALFGLATAPQFPVMLTYLERRIHVSGSATSWFIGGAGLGGLVFPWLIGQWFDVSGATVLPLSMLIMAVLTTGAFVAADRVLGG